MKENVLAKLRAISIFEGIDGGQLDAIADLMTTRSAAKGEAVVTEGEMGDEMFVLLEGAVVISRRTLDDEQYTVAELHAQDNHFFGELALLDEDRRSATITAREKCVLLALKRDDFMGLGESESEMALRITRRLAQRVSQQLRETNQDVILLFEALVTEVRARESE